MDLATPALIAEVNNLQRKIQVDEPANIQFTLVDHHFFFTILPTINYHDKLILFYVRARREIPKEQRFHTQILSIIPTLLE